MMEQVILVNEHDEQIGVTEKLYAHEHALLHRAFSVFIFNAENQMLLQQRAVNKYHSGGLWSNACCSHPKPGEDIMLAATRRLQEEMGFTTALSKVFSFTYITHFENGLTEHEIDHVFTGTYSGAIHPDPNEVKDYCYKPIDEIQELLATQPQQFSSWFHIAFPKILSNFKYVE